MTEAGRIYGEILEEFRKFEEEIEKEHPLRALHHLARRVLSKIDVALMALDREIEELEGWLDDVLWALKARHGPGYITVKSVKNRYGKRYSYVIFRTYAKDIYLPKELGERIIKARRSLRLLKARKRRLRKIRTTVWGWMKSTEHYA